MNLTVYRDESGFDALKEEWNSLLQRSRFNTIFLTWEWQTTWWRYLGRQRGPLYLLAVRQDDRLAGIIPLYGTADDGAQVLNIVGCIEVSDYLDLIVEAGQEDAIYAAFLAWLSGPDAPAWDLVDLCNLPAPSLTHTRLPEMAAAAGFQVEVLQEDVAPAIVLPLPSDSSEEAIEEAWERYLAGLDKKERHEIRRKLRRIEREAPDAQVRFVTGPDGLEAAMDDFIALHRFSRADKHAFMTEEMQAYFRGLAARLAEVGWLQLSFLDVGGRPVATYFCFDYNNEILVYNSGYDPAGVPHLSPGWVLLAHLIHHAIGLGRARFDFLQGNEDYKYRFRGTDMPIYRTLLRPGKGS